MKSASGWGQPDALQLADPVLVRHALGLELRDQLVARAVALREQDRHRILEDRLDQRDQLERVAGGLAVQGLRGLDQIERERREEREVELEGFLHAQAGPSAASSRTTSAMPAWRSERTSCAARRRRRAFEAGVSWQSAISCAHRAPALAARPGCIRPLEQVHQDSVVHVEDGAEHLGRARDQLVEGGAAPGDEAARRLLLGRVLLGARARSLAEVQDHVLGSLGDHAAAHVEALAPGAAGDLAELAHAQDRDLLAVELAQLREEHAADRDVDAHPERVGAAHDLEQTALRQPLDQQPVAGQQPRVVDADPVAQDAAQVLAVGRVEAEAAERLGDPRPILARREVRAGEPLRELAALALREVHHVDGRPPLRDQLAEGLVDRRLAVLEVERHRRAGRNARARPRLRCARAGAPRSPPCCRASRTSAGSACAGAAAAGSARRRRARDRRRSGTRPSRPGARRGLRPGAAPCSRAPRRCSTGSSPRG